ncbi:aspartate-semialdehyde dehydrogenase [Sinorhizobium medicae]|uniref:aspartate-semialdehyde dehydrogenase n=1 Tax=Sinorhizobium medicae TaxID=110321 RepID=UPI001297BEFD|nr:aspartate-semialdehyde dehydrogenase [Sinorhizobium medicae]MQX94728.1 aspartate-semialdehyde dehydrogenase [Sinorhizobium medicae]MQX95945.1 aspartate-semialdehyde dehydrogenase [Sinorhizobium medicae]MQX98054.1 aspartate-semialdehyde dehydrogenase [Sinorhizobium medicae]MQX98689.1 aspartate-semialdehyde dehydrogenase [Sinorhizobium medicae]
MRALNISIVGATGAVGAELTKLLEASQIPVNRLRLLASSNSAGRQVRFRDEICFVEPLGEIGDLKADIAFLCAGGAVSATWGPLFAAQGALVIDNSNAFRMDPDVPLVVPQVNPGALSGRPQPGIVANPNCSTIQLVRAVRPLVAALDVHQIILTTYQAASGGGLIGIDELRNGTRAALEGSSGPPAARFPVPLPFNVIPQVGEIDLEGGTLEELKLAQEARKILAMPDLRLTSTCVRVPVENGHSEAVYIEFEKPLRLEHVHELLAKEAGVRLYADGIRKGYPTPRFLANPEDVHVGRVRVNPENPRGLWLWVVADNLQVGAALNALLIAQLAIANRVIGEI